MNLTEILSRDLRGRDYLNARGLVRKVKIGDLAPQSHPNCDHCNAQERLATVQRIVSHWEPIAKPAESKKRMRSIK